MERRLAQVVASIRVERDALAAELASTRFELASARFELAASAAELQRMRVRRATLDARPASRARERRAKTRRGCPG